MSLDNVILVSIRRVGSGARRLHIGIYFIMGKQS